MFAARVARRPLTTLGVIIMLLAAWLSVAFPDNAHAASASSVNSSQKADVTHDYLEIQVAVTRTYKPRLNRAAKVKFTNPNPSNSVRVKFQDDDYKWIPKSKIIVPPNSTVVAKFRMYEVYFSIAVIVDGDKLPFQGGSLDLRRRF
jgi:hypothetical protein